VKIKMSIEKVTRLIKGANNITVLTGAGISTESGIPDFRSRTGIYSSNPLDILSIQYFEKHPKEFWDFMKQYLNWTNVEPNVGHKILAKWEQKGYVKNIITQNIDGLHQKAGSQNVLQVHGTMATATCEGCFRKYNMDFVMKQGEPYKCIGCGDPYVRPDVILFGETVDASTEAFKIAKTTDLLLVLGTSLQVYPVASIPKKIRYNGHTVIINYMETDFDYRRNTTKISAGIGDTLTEIDKLLED